MSQLASYSPKDEMSLKTLAADLDRAHTLFQNGVLIDEPMAVLADSTREARRHLPTESWKKAIDDLVRPHAVTSLVHQDPFTYRSFTKPRGYPGDAVLLDYIYGVDSSQPPPSDTSPLGKAIFGYSTRRYAPEAVRWRCRHIADAINALWSTSPNPRVFSVACGHMRELEYATYSIQGSGKGWIVAMDQDADSLRGVTETYGDRLPIEPMRLRVLDLLFRPPVMEPFDLAYSLGLFDYLDDSTAARLIHRMLDLVLPGGRVVVANFLPDIEDVGYMEAFMDWHLTYRTGDDLVRLLPEGFAGTVSTLTDPCNNVVVLIAEKT